MPFNRSGRFAERRHAPARAAGEIHIPPTSAQNFARAGSQGCLERSERLVYIRNSICLALCIIALGLLHIILTTIRSEPSGCLQIGDVPSPARYERSFQLLERDMVSKMSSHTLSVRPQYIRVPRYLPSHFAPGDEARFGTVYGCRPLGAPSASLHTTGLMHRIKCVIASPDSRHSR